MPTTCCKGPGFPTPKDAATKGERERLLYVVCVRKSEGGDEATPDYIATVDVDPQSSTYCKVRQIECNKALTWFLHFC